MSIFTIAPVQYLNGKMLILDQTKLPGEEIYIEMKTAEDVWNAIYRLQVRGAPAIGVAAAYGLYVTVKDLPEDNLLQFGEVLHEAAGYLAGARPTAVNLAWALKRMTDKYDQLTTTDCLAVGDSHNPNPVKRAKEILFAEAEAIRIEDEAACRAMGEHGLTLLKPGMGILTHCNAGTLATAKLGTCLAPIYLGQERGYAFKVFADETRPLLQGARLTAWELHKSGIDVTLVCDNMAALIMRKGWVQAVVTGCDRMAANGDGANKIGTSGLAILAREYGIPFYMYVPTSTIDLDTPTGDEIEIEERNGEEIYKLWYKQPMAPEGIKTYNPAFDVTPAEYITAVVTEKGIVRPPYEESLKKLFQGEQ